MYIYIYANLAQIDALLACQGEMFKGLMFIFVSTTSKLGPCFERMMFNGPKREMLSNSQVGLGDPNTSGERCFYGRCWGGSSHIFSKGGPGSLGFFISI